MTYLRPIVIAVLIIIIFAVLIIIIRTAMGKKIEKEMKVWVNRSKNELLHAWGPPTSIFPFDDGKEIWSYNRVKTADISQRVSTDGALVEGIPKYTIKREFFINEYGIVYSYRWENM